MLLKKWNTGSQLGYCVVCKSDLHLCLLYAGDKVAHCTTVVLPREGVDLLTIYCLRAVAEYREYRIEANAVQKVQMLCVLHALSESMAMQAAQALLHALRLLEISVCYHLLPAA